MSKLTIYREDNPATARVFTEPDAIARELGAVGVLFERWVADRELPDDASQDEIIAAYRDSVDRLMAKYGCQSVDVVSLKPDHPDREALRAKFLNEHTHSDYEVRFFVDGQGLFCIHKAGLVYATLCERGDLISVPGDTPHWFDMGPRPDFKCIRLFTTPEGWVARFTESDIAGRFPRLDN
jgi:1,2-dihydroxy-3-keto-5-methylthiopentene dioxygenase